MKKQSNPIMDNSLRSVFEESIKPILRSSFERKLLTATFDNLDKGGSLCFNNFSYALRELLRHILHRLAPDDSVKKCSWFKPNKAIKNGSITRKQRITYAIQGGLSDEFVSKKLNVDVKNTCKKLLDAIEVLNKFTHIEQSTFGISQKEVNKHVSICLEAVRVFVEEIIWCRKEVAEAVVNLIDMHLIDAVISDSISSMDELATHYYIDEVLIDDIKVVQIDFCEIELIVEGTVGCELQYGSNSDVKNDIGLVASDSFPLYSNITVKIVPGLMLGTEALVTKIKVDTAGFYE